MKKILSGTFEQVEDAISESFVENTFDSIKRWNGLRALIALFFFGGGTYFMYGLGWGIAHYGNEAVIYINPDNEYLLFFSNFHFFWFTNLASFLFLLSVVIDLMYRNKNNVKSLPIVQLILLMFMLLFMTQTFSVFQLVVNNTFLRNIYTVLFVICIIYAFIKGYKNAYATIYEDKKKRSTLIEWASKHQKEILGVLFAFGGVNYFFKTVNDSARDFEKNLIGALIDYIPIIVSLATLFVMLYGLSVLIRSYYLYKYSEEFRVKFGYEKEDWYGKDYQKTS